MEKQPPYGTYPGRQINDFTPFQVEFSGFQGKSMECAEMARPSRACPLPCDGPGFSSSVDASHPGQKGLGERRGHESRMENDLIPADLTHMAERGQRGAG